MGKFWIYIVVSIFPLYFRGSEKGVSVLDVIFGVFLIGTLLFWLFKKILLDKEKLIDNFGEWLLIFFFIMLLFNFFVAVSDDVEPLNWLREYAIALPVLYFLPIKYYFSEKKALSKLLVYSLIIILILNITQFYGYYKLAYSNLIYSFQLGQSLKENQCAFTTATMLPLVFALYHKSFWKRMVLMLISSISLLALITTFSRTFWLIVLLEVIILFFIVQPKYKFRIIRYLVVAGIIFSGSVLIFFKGNAQVVFEYVERRFSSTAKGIQDISVLSRLYEYDKVWERIKDAPLGGNGLGNTFSFFNPITLNTTTQNFSHNGYLQFLFKFGFPLTIIFIFILLYYLTYSMYLALNIKETFYKCIAISSFFMVLLMIIADFSAHNFFLRDGTFIIAFFMAFTSIAKKQFYIENNQVSESFLVYQKI